MIPYNMTIFGVVSGDVEGIIEVVRTQRFHPNLVGHDKFEDAFLYNFYLVVGLN